MPIFEPLDFIARPAAMTWAQRLRRVFNIELEQGFFTCECQDSVKILLRLGEKF